MKWRIGRKIASFQDRRRLSSVQADDDRSGEKRIGVGMAKRGRWREVPLLSMTGRLFDDPREQR